MLGFVFILILYLHDTHKSNFFVVYQKCVKMSPFYALLY